MAVPTKKSLGVETFLTFNNPKGRRGSIEANECVQCCGPASTFKDALSRREFTISGLCQTCQDRFFEEEE
jgi:hypothetical protein